MTSSQAVSIGLIVTELVINALKHAFPAATMDGQVVVAYELAGTNWKLSISDNGVGVPEESIVRSRQKNPDLAPASSRRSRNS